MVESQNRNTGLGVALRHAGCSQRGFSPRYDHMGTHRVGGGGLWEQMTHQGLDPDAIVARIRKLA